MLEDLTLSRCRFTLEITRQVSLPEFTGSTLRGAFGTVFRKIICAQRQREDCKGCYLQNTCAYAAVFTPGNLQDSPYFPKNESLPPPFLFHIEEEKKTGFSVGEEINLLLTLVGKGADYFPYFFIVLQELGRQGFGIRGNGGQRGSFEIKKVADDLAPDKKIIFTAEKETKISPLHREKLGNFFQEMDDLSLLKVRYLTPFRVKWQGRLCSEIKFHILIRNILRRVSALYFISEHKPLQLDYRSLISQAENIQTVQAQFQWKEYSRYSSRQKEKMQLGGVTGWALYQGEGLSRFHPFLKAAELMAAGKGTTFGFGRIALEVVEKGG
ncbi:MAG: CRISPR system precrRNA processing endoribonuclease RAMP protein Cas6 [Firmicutes bacterium]|mgnify:CR=1 FL=1|jgi:hypothetical protein|nr:CRISPR system precrRNA processing endoribonuclease RAMP protein Cas6 [Bacillota bacterium]